MGKYDLLILGGLGLATVYAWQKGHLDFAKEEVDKLLSGGGLGGLGKGGKEPKDGGGKEEPTDGDGGKDGGGEPATGGATGSCSGGPYKGTGKVLETKTKGPTTRHYASGKADDKTIEKNTTGIKFRNYQFVSYVTVKKIEHDDNVSVKLGGRHMNGGWYDHGISFNSGQGCLGTEKKHPSTQSCIVKGKSVGKIVGKKIGIAGVMINGKTEVWGDVGKGWQNLASATNPGGFKQLSGDNECQLRIDGWEDVEIHCSNVQEITTTAAKYARAFPTYPVYEPVPIPSVPVRTVECGFMCAYETTSIPDIQLVQRGLRR